MLWIGLCLLATVAAYKPSKLIEETHHTEESFQKFHNKLNKLSQIQEQINDEHSGTRIKGPAKRPTAPAPVDINKEVQAKPDQLPDLYQGDIVLTETQIDKLISDAEDQLAEARNETLRRKRSMTSDLSLRWTFPIPFYINTATGVSTSAVLAGVNKWQQDTCVTFTQLTSLPRTQALNFILGQGCYSYIGRAPNGPQTVSIGYGCTSLGTVTHEIGHALGFYHEQARWDRDNYVQIMTQNIQSVYLSQFTKQSQLSMVDYGVGYDLGSVMHYDQAAFTSNNLPTIKTLDPNYQITIGQRVAPSFADVKRINFAYCNSSCSTQLNCQNGGYTDPKACSQCRCPDGFGGTLCDVAGTGDAGCPAGDLTATSDLKTIQASGLRNCPFVITAPEGKKIFFQMGTFAFTNWPPCQIDYLEIKYGDDFTRTGARMCATYPSTSLSTTNRLVLIYHGSANSAFSLTYRYDPPTPVATTTSTTTTSTTTTTTTATTTAPTTTPTTRATTKSTTTKRWTWFPPRTTTSTTTTTTTTTPIPVNTFFPPTQIGCSPWSTCTADCGGCGTQSRSCNGQLQTQYCNLNPCNNGYCCLPYFNLDGRCVKPY